jgi:hypothetical protein
LRQLNYGIILEKRLAFSCQELSKLNKRNSYPNIFWKKTYMKKLKTSVPNYLKENMRLCPEFSKVHAVQRKWRFGYLAL